MLKLLPHVASGSWILRQTMGTLPVIIGKALKTTYHATDRYIEVDIDVSANPFASYAVGMCRGAAKSLAVDIGAQWAVEWLVVPLDRAASVTMMHRSLEAKRLTPSPLLSSGFVLEGSAPWELPECLLGALRLEKGFEVGLAKPLNMEREVPLWPETA